MVEVPTVRFVASCDEERVLVLWYGLLALFEIKNLLLQNTVPYFFVRLYLHYFIYRDSEAGSLVASHLFAATLSLCFHSHFLLILDVLDIFLPQDVRVFLLKFDVTLLLLLLVFIFPVLIIWAMTRTITTWRKSVTIVALSCFLFSAWELGSFFPTNDEKSKFLSMVSEMGFED